MRFLQAIENTALFALVMGCASSAVFVETQALAQTVDPSQAVLSELALFHRCYSHMTQRRLSHTHPYYAAVAAGSMTAVDACMQIFDTATLIQSGASEGTFVNPATESQSVIRSFNDLHRTWFPNDNIPLSLPEGVEIYHETEQYHDSGESALHITRSLFTPNVPYSEIVTGTSPMEALRAGGLKSNPYTYTDPNTGQTVTETSLHCTNPYSSSNSCGALVPLNAQLVQQGSLLGVRRMTSNVTKYATVANPGAQPYPVTTPPQSQVKVHQHFGGGILGSQSYLLLNFGRQSNMGTNGGLLMPRRWSRAVLGELMCRDLPALRTSDAIPYVQSATTSLTPPFRTSKTCMACHSTIDPMAANARNLVYVFLPGRVNVANFPTVSMGKWNVTQTREVGYVDDDPKYYLRPPNGELFYRSYDGSVVRTPTQGITDLGSKVAQTNDLYVCAASKYFQYFTGIKVNLQDIGDPAKPALTLDELMYRNEVIQFGVNLKSDPQQSLRTLIYNIISSPIYRKMSIRDSSAQGISP